MSGSRYTLRIRADIKNRYRYRSIFLAVFQASSICRFAATNSWTVMLMYGLLADAAARGRPRLAPAELLPLRYAAHRRF